MTTSIIKSIYTILALTFLSASLSAQWNNRSSMNSIRAGHASVAMSDGRLLVAGGWDYNSNLKTAEIYDPINDSWTVVPEMSSEHYKGAGVLLNDGNVLVIAGFTGAFNTEDCELFDVTTNTWSSAGFLSQGRSYFTATKLNDGKVLVVGGFDGTNNISSCEIYDPALNSWSAAGELAVGRSYHTANLLPDGKVIVTGGFNPNAGFQLNSTEIYDPALNTWSPGAPMISGRDYHAASVLNDGRLLVTGGRFFNGSTNYAYNGIWDTEIYNPGNNTWDFGASLPIGISYHQQVTLDDGNVIAVAGVDSSNFSDQLGFTTFASTTLLYDADAEIWTELPLNLDARYEFGLSKLTSGAVIVTGGEDDSVEGYNLDSSVGIEKSNSSAKLYPNPASSQLFLNIEGENSIESYSIIDLRGREVVTRLISPAKKIAIQTNELESGYYLLRIVDTQHVISTYKFGVQRN